MRRLKETNYEGYKSLYKVITKCIGDAKFKLEECDTISGDDEGLFGWIAVNYSTGRFSSAEERPRGFMEIGGESAQIAFCPSNNDHADYQGTLTRVVVGGRTFDVFTKTWLGLGSDAVWKRHEEKLLENDTVLVDDPCLPKGYSYRLGDKIIVGTGNFKECLKEIFSFLRCKDGCRGGDLCAHGGCLLGDAPGLGFSDDANPRRLRLLARNARGLRGGPEPTRADSRYTRRDGVSIRRGRGSIHGGDLRQPLRGGHSTPTKTWAGAPPRESSNDARSHRGNKAETLREQAGGSVRRRILQFTDLPG